MHNDSFRRRLSWHWIGCQKEHFPLGETVKRKTPSFDILGDILIQNFVWYIDPFLPLEKLERCGTKPGRTSPTSRTIPYQLILRSWLTRAVHLIGITTGRSHKELSFGSCCKMSQCNDTLLGMDMPGNKKQGSLVKGVTKQPKNIWRCAS